MNRTELINFLIKQREYKRYLEISIGQECFNFPQIVCDHKYKIDVDLSMTINYHDHNKQRKCDFDIILIDGILTEEKVEQDISYALECLSKDGVIILHDCMPPDEWHQRGAEEAYMDGQNWNGTTWKAVLRYFNKTKHKCFLIETDWGCGVIDTAKQQSPLFRELPTELDYNQHFTWLFEYKISVVNYLKTHIEVFYHLVFIPECLTPMFRTL
jgi:hypothetical protein